MTPAASGGRVDLALHGVSLGLTSQLPSFLAYVEATMAPFLVPAASQPPRVESTLEWVEGSPSRDLARAFGATTWDRRPDRDLYLEGTTVYWLRIDDFEDLQIAATWANGRLRLHGRYHFRLGRGRGEALRSLLYRRRRASLEARRFSTLLYYLVYHPLLWILSREQGWELIHAGAVASADGAAVFAGMPGCGKSTLAVAMTADPRWDLLSDNLLLHDSDRVLACPEMLLLDERSIARVGVAVERLKASGERRVYEREAYRPDTTCLAPVRPLAIFHVERAKATSLRAITASDSARRLWFETRMAKEVRRSLLMSRILDLVSGREEPDGVAARASLVERSRSYELQVAEGADLSEVIARHVLPALGERARLAGARRT
jgi:hypothetical protein